MGFTSFPLYNTHATNKVTDALFLLIVFFKVTELALQVPDTRQPPP